MRILTLLLVVLALPAAAHEFWLEPLDYRVDADGKVEARLVNGELFEGVNLPYLPRRFVDFRQFAPDGERPVDGRMGDNPGLQTEAMGDGLQIFVFVSTVSDLTYDEWDAFMRFARHKDFADIVARHDARDLPREGFGEAYARFAKTLVAAGDGGGADMRTGLETEIVALANPYTDDLSDGLPVQVWYGEDVRADAQVELFAKAPDGSVEVTYHRTDGDGVAVLPVVPGHAYLVDAVVLREPSEEIAAEHDAVWETLWASLTFAVPE